MSWRPIHSLFVIIVTSVTANHQGVQCDCASQGPWQPLFKPSQILHSEFPEHKDSDSTGGPKPVKIRHYKLVPHIVVPVVNPLAYTIHPHVDDNQIDNDNTLKYTKTKSSYGKKKIKDVNFHYNLPDSNESNQPTPEYNDAPSSSTPSDNNYVNDYRDDGHVQNDHQDDTHNGYDDNHNHHSQEDYGTHSTPVNSHENSNESSSQHDDRYSEEDTTTTYNSYYGSGERNDAVYDASKLSPGYQLKPHSYTVYKNDPAQSERDKLYGNSNYYRSNDNEIQVRVKNRGKSIYIPVYRITEPSNMALKKPESFNNVLKTNIDHVEPIVLPSHTTKYQSNRPSLPIPLYHTRLQKELPPTHGPAPLNQHQTVPIAHPPFTINHSWRFLLGNEAKQLSVMRPPAPGLIDTWSTQTKAESSIHMNMLPTKLKMTGVIYPIKKYQIRRTSNNEDYI